MNTVYLSHILTNLDEFSWKDWVFIASTVDIGPTSKCLVINTSEAELGSDGFTPLEVERCGMEEFLSVADLKDVLVYLSNVYAASSVEIKCEAAAYYFNNDSFMPMDKLV